MTEEVATTVSWKKFVPGMIWFLLVTFLLCLPGSDLPSTQDWMNVIYFDKLVHIGLFCVLSFLFMWPVLRSKRTVAEKWNHCIKIAMAACLYGITSEFIQKYFIAGRNFDLVDWSADTLGAIIALVFSKLRFLKKV